MLTRCVLGYFLMCIFSYEEQVKSFRSKSLRIGRAFSQVCFEFLVDLREEFGDNDVSAAPMAGLFPPAINLRRHLLLWHRAVVISARDVAVDHCSVR